MSLAEIIEGLTAGEMAGWGLVLLFGLLSLIQVSPLKLNPWDRIFAWIGKKMNGATEKRLEELERQVSDMWINNHRQCTATQVTSLIMAGATVIGYVIGEGLADSGNQKSEEGE